MRYDVEIEALDEVGVVAVEAFVHGLARAALAMGAVLPEGARAVAIPDGVMHRCGPESLLVMTGIAEAQPLAARLGGMLDEASAIVADLSDGHGWVRLSGRDATGVLAQGVAIDLRETALSMERIERYLLSTLDMLEGDVLVRAEIEQLATDAEVLEQIDLLNENLECLRRRVARLAACV